MFYVQLVTQYLVTTEFDDDTVQAIMDEALKYEGWRYVYGGASPTTSFDCSGLTQWTYGKAGINLPRTAQQQYDVTQHIPLSEAQAGDLVFILPITLALILLMLGYTLAITVCFMQATQSVMPT